MQTWAKRGLQTALVTGGLLMLGTGIASADEDVNPDKPASPLDGSLTVPVHIDNNALGSPLGQQDLPEFHKDVGISGSELTGAMPKTEPTVPAAPELTQVEEAVAPVLDDAALTDAAPVADALPRQDVLGDDLAMGNRITGDMAVPIDICGNAIAVLGAAEAECDSSQSVDYDNSVATDGTDGFIAGNVIDLDWALPVQITGNAGALLGSATATSTSTQDASVTGDTTTSGSGGVASGNVLTGQAATPVQIAGNALAGGGDATADSEAETAGTAGGTVLTDGSGGLGDGNVGAVPVAVPVELNGNSGGLLADTDATADTSAEATAGDTQPGMFGVPTYLETTGEDSLAGGNIAQAPLAGDAMLCGNALIGGGDADAEATCATEETAGGTNRTTGAGSVLGGGIADTPVAMPLEIFGNAGVIGGEADALTDKTADAVAGGDSYTRGHESLLGGTTASTPVATPGDIFANAIAGLGDATAEATHDTETTAGGNTGTTGDDSLGGGNLGTIPVAIPVEGFGNSAAGAGGAESTAEEIKVVSAGGGSNTDDDNGVGASNLLSAPVAGAVQAFGNSAGLVAIHKATATNDLEVTSGGPANATGTAGLLSGNIGQAPVSLPLQMFGSGASGLANGVQTAVNYSELTAGGDNTTDGTDGVGSGNVATTPVAGAGQFFGNAIAVLGLDDAVAGSETDSTAGGDTETSGMGGFLSGNVAAGQAMPVAQVFGDAVSGLGGVATAVATNKTVTTSGGDIDTNGDQGFLSGNLVDVPAAAVAQPFGDAGAAIASLSAATGLSQTDGTVGGLSTTSGDFGSLSGIDGTLPVGLNLPIYDVPIEVLAEALTNSANDSNIAVGEADPQLDAPLNGAMAPTDLPTLMPTARSMPADDFSGAFTGVLDGFTSGMNGLPGQGAAVELTEAVSSATQGEMPGQYHILPYPLPQEGRADTPQVPGLPGLPAGGDMLKLNTPLTGDLFSGLGGVGRDVPMGPNLPGLSNAPVVSDLGGLTDVTTVIPAVPAASDLLEIPGVPEVPGVSEAPGLSQVPGVSEVPGLPEAPGLPEVPALSGLGTPGLDRAEQDTPSLNATRVLLANLFTQHPIG